MRYDQRIRALLGGQATGDVLEIDGNGDRVRLAAVRDHSLDAVTSVNALAATDDVAAVLDEVHRVLKPGGRLVFVELVAAPAESRRRQWQWLLAPLWRQTVPVDPSPRDLWNDLRAARFANLRFELFDQPGILGLAVPHLAGVAITGRRTRAAAQPALPRSLTASSPRALTNAPRAFFG
jgi:SAM-dependent methyltransferase